MPAAASRDVAVEITRSPCCTFGRAAMTEAFAGRHRVVALLGDAGIGKSRLLSRAGAEAAERGARVIVGRAYRAEQILPLGPWTDALRDGAVLDDPDVTERLHPASRVELMRLLPEKSTDAPGPASSAHGSRVEDPARLFAAMAELVESLTSARPVALLFEDVHWADELTLRLLAFLGRRLRARPVLTIVTVREEDLVDAPAVRALLDDLDREQRLVRISPGALSREETSSLVRAMVRTEDEGALRRLTEQIWIASEGNPFMVVETVRAVEEGSSAATTATVPLPERVRQVVVARLERLSDAGRGLVGVAAVIGRDFDFTLLQRAAQLDDGVAATTVEELVRRRVLRLTGDRFEFTHDRIREVAYGQLFLPRRRLLHRQTAEALRALHGAALEPHRAALGLHSYEGERWEEAITEYRRAGEWALARSANREAAVCFERALAALERAPERAEKATLAIDLRLELRNAFVLLGDADRALAYLTEAQGLATTLGDRVRLGRVSAQLSFHRSWAGRPGEARVLALTAQAIGEETADGPLTMTATLYLAYAHRAAGDYRAGRQVLDRLLEMLGSGASRERHGQHVLPSAGARYHLTACLAQSGEFEAAIACGREALVFGERVDHRISVISACMGLGEAYVVRGATSEALPVLERALELCSETTVLFTRPMILGWLGYAHSLAGRPGEGRRLLHEALAAQERSSRLTGLSRLLGQLGETELLDGRLGEARGFAERSLAFARQHEERGSEAWALHLAGEIEAQSAPRPGDAGRAHFDHAMTLAEELGMRPLVAHCHAALGRLDRRTGTPSEADERLRTARAMYREMGMSRWASTVEE